MLTLNAFGKCRRGHLYRSCRYVPSSKDTFFFLKFFFNEFFFVDFFFLMYVVLCCVEEGRLFFNFFY